MSDWEEPQPEDTVQGVHWLQMGIWGLFLSVVMFGLGFLAGSHWGEQKAAERPPAFVTRLIPPPVEIRPPEREETQPGEGEASGRVWGILTGKEGAPAADPASTLSSPKVKPAESSPKVQTPLTAPVSPPEPSSTPGAAVAPPAPIPAPPHAMAPTSPGGARYSLQVMSVPVRERAEAIVKDLAAKGYPAVRLVPAEIPGRGTWFRIRLGAFERREEAEGWARQIRDRERMQPQVVVEKN